MREITRGNSAEREWSNQGGAEAYPEKKLLSPDDLAKELKEKRDAIEAIKKEESKKLAQLRAGKDNKYEMGASQQM